MATQRPDGACHTRTVRSFDAEATYRPSGDELSDSTVSECPRSASTLNVSASKRRTSGLFVATASLVPPAPSSAGSASIASTSSL